MRLKLTLALALAWALACAGGPSTEEEAPAPAVAPEEAPEVEAPPPPAEDAWPEVKTRIDEGGLALVQVADLVEVLDVNAHHGALRLIHHAEHTEDDTGSPPYDCQYAGMQEYGPARAVTLALVDLSTGLVQTWDVYPKAFQAEQCASHDASRAALEEAKAAMAAQGLDPAKKPAGIDLSAGSGILERPWGQVELSWEGTRHYELEDPVYVEVFGAEGDALSAVAQGKLTANGHVLYQGRHRYQTMMAGMATSRCKAAYPTEGGIVLLEEVEYFSGRGGTSFGYTLSPELVVP